MRGAKAYIAKSVVKVEDDDHESNIKRGEEFYLKKIGSKYYVLDVEGRDIYQFLVTKKVYLALEKKHTPVDTDARDTRMQKAKRRPKRGETPKQYTKRINKVTDEVKNRGKSTIQKESKLIAETFNSPVVRSNQAPNSFQLVDAEFNEKKVTKTMKDLGFELTGRPQQRLKFSHNNGTTVFAFGENGKMGTLHLAFLKMQKPKVSELPDITDKELEALPSVKLEGAENELFYATEAIGTLSYNVKREKSRLRILQKAKRQTPSNAREQKQIEKILPGMQARLDKQKDTVKAIKANIKKLKKLVTY